MILAWKRWWGGDPLKNLVDLCEKGEGLSWGWAINKCKACFRCILRRWFWSPVCLCAAVHCPETAQAGIAVNSLVICARFLGACFFLSLMFFLVVSLWSFRIRHTHTHTKPKTKQLRHLHVVVYKNGALPFLSRLPLLKDGWLNS